MDYFVFFRFPFSGFSFLESMAKPEIPPGEGENMWGSDRVGVFQDV